jgi:hypothetical protein
MKHQHSVRLTGMRGYSIIHALISLIIFASITVAGLQWQRFTASVDKGRTIGQQYLTLNAAVNNYMVTYYQALSVLNPRCSEMTFTTVDPATPSWAQSNPSKCALTIATGKVVANGFQPSPAELIMLGLLPASPTNPPNPPDLSGLLQIESPHLPIAKIVYEYSPTATLTPSALSQPRLFINIDMVCVQRGTATNPNTGTAVPTAPGVNGCDSATTTTALKSMIFNTQPYNNNQKNYLFTFSALLGSVFSTIGDDAVSSGMVDVKLVNTNNMLNGKNFQLTHPIKGGPSGILGLRGGYGASYAMQHSRVDGSNPPTADWSFGGHGITSGLSKLKLPVQVLGTACDNKEDIALDATANLLVCRNSIWSTSSSEISGTLNVKDFYLLLVQQNPEKYTSNGYVYLGKFVKNVSISTEVLPSFGKDVKYNFPYANGDICMRIETGLDSRYWAVVTTGIGSGGGYYFMTRREYPANEYEYVVVACTNPVNIFVNLTIFFYKINE